MHHPCRPARERPYQIKALDILEKMQPTLNSFGRNYATHPRSHSLGRCLLLLAEVLL